MDPAPERKVAALETLDGPALEVLKRRAKKQLRQRMRTLRGALPAAALAARNAALLQRLLELPEVAGARRIALYFPMEERNEVDLRPLDAACRARGATVYYPRMTDPPDPMSPPVFGFAAVTSLTELAEAGHGFQEPAAALPEAAPGEIDTIVVPALAVSGTGHRLGYGAGFYDRVLARFCPPARSVVVAYEFQLLAELPQSEGDVACNVVVTDGRVLRL